MNKNTAGIPGYPLISVDHTDHLPLGPFWDRLRLIGHFWRFYHHDAPGAGICIGSQKIELLPDFCYLLPPNCDLRTWCSGTPRQLYIHFEPAMCAPAHNFHYGKIPFSPMLQELSEKLLHELRTAESHPARRSLLSVALASYAMSMLPDDSFREPDMDRRIVNICNVLRNNLAGDFSISELSARVQMTPNSFLRHFRENTGVSPYQYLLELRYNQASKLLRSYDLSIDEICEQIGVHDRFHFSRTFKKIFGIPPAQYRKRHINDIV